MRAAPHIIESLSNDQILLKLCDFQAVDWHCHCHCPSPPSLFCFHHFESCLCDSVLQGSSCVMTIPIANSPLRGRQALSGRHVPAAGQRVPPLPHSQPCDVHADGRHCQAMPSQPERGSGALEWLSDCVVMCVCVWLQRVQAPKASAVLCTHWCVVLCCVVLRCVVLWCV